MVERFRPHVGKHPDGEYVHYSDYAALEKERDDFAAKFDAANSTLLTYEACLREQRAPVVGVKPLEWIEGNPGVYWAETAFSDCAYHLVRQINGKVRIHRGDLKDWRQADLISEAQEICQADYVSRIRAALVDAPASAPEPAEQKPVAWQRIDAHSTIHTPEQYGMRLPLAEGKFRPLYTDPLPVERIVEVVRDLRQRIKNARGAIESGQVVDKDVHGSLGRAIEQFDALLSDLRRAGQ